MKRCRKSTKIRIIDLPHDEGDVLLVQAGLVLVLRGARSDRHERPRGSQRSSLNRGRRLAVRDAHQLRDVRRRLADVAAAPLQRRRGDAAGAAGLARDAGDARLVEALRLRERLRSLLSDA